MVREANAELEPNALEAVKNETGIFWLNFADMICPAIAIYLRASGLRSIREDYGRINERCEALEDRIDLLTLREKNITASISTVMSENVFLRQAVDTEVLGEMVKLHKIRPA
jgi:hypothetical protein